MSKLKAQLKEMLPRFSAEANKLRDPEARKRWELVRAVALSPKPVSAKCRALGASADQFYKYAGKLVASGRLGALRSRSRRPRRSPRRLKGRIARKLCALRNAEPSHGAERIARDYGKLYGERVAPSTAHAALKRAGLVTKARAKRLTKKHMKRYRRQWPGYLQMDVKYVPFPVTGRQLYAYNAVDHCTTWRFTRIYDRLCHESTAEFARELERACPFAIFEVQTDNGFEFTDKYQGGRLRPSGLHPLDLWCAENGIVHRLIPVGQKELNGKVENTHKQDDREFYAGLVPKKPDDLKRAMVSWNERWNERRDTKALGWKTPLEKLEDAMVAILAWSEIARERWPGAALPRLDVEGNAFMPAGPSKPKAQPRKPKRRTAVDRYLQWHEWDEGKRLKAAIPLSPMSLSSPASPLGLKTDAVGAEIVRRRGTPCWLGAPDRSR